MKFYYTVGGELHFLQIGGTCDDIDEADILVDGSLSKGIEPSSEVPNLYQIPQVLAFQVWY